MTIDWWTLFIQSVNIVVLIGLLGRFFWRPVAAMIEERRRAAQSSLDEAAAKNVAAAAALADIEVTRAGFAAERDAILAAARAAAEQERAAILARAASEAAAIEAAAKDAAAAEREATDRAWRERAGRLAVDLAGRLAARLDGPAVEAAFLDWLLTALRELPEPTRLAATQEGVVLRAVSATPIDPADQSRMRAAIGAALGGDARIDFETDPGLIAGLELIGPHLAVTNSWRADLARLLADIGHDDQS